MNIAAYIRYWFLIHKTRPRRYRALFRTIYQTACRTIVEIGVFDGVHAVQMIQTASVHQPLSNIRYYGFDLFEDLTEELLKSEFSKRPTPYTVVQRKLEATGAKIDLFKGDSKQTLPKSLHTIGKADFIFIDGGHSVTTIQSDWNAVKELMGESTVVIFDDYCLNDHPEIDGYGCQTIIDHLDRQLYDVTLLEPADQFRREWGMLKIKMALVKKAVPRI